MQEAMTTADDFQHMMTPFPLAGASAFDLLAADPRPSFVVLLPPTSSSSSSHSIAYVNPVLQANGPLLDAITAPAEENAQLWEWVLQRSDASSAPFATPVSFLHSTIHWTRVVIREDLVVVGGNEQPSPWDALRNTRSAPPRLADSPKARESFKDRHVDAFPAGPEAFLGRQTSAPIQTSAGTAPEEKSFLEVIYNVDWASTPLGPTEVWPSSLQRVFTQILADTMPIAIYWGPERTTLYNEAFGKLCGSKHPTLLGRPIEGIWPQMASTLTEGGPARGESRFFMEKAPYGLVEPTSVEETFLNWSIVPLHENNVRVGFQQSIVNNTAIRLWERRMKMLVDLGDNLIISRDVHSFWDMTIQGLEAADPSYDVPLAVLYSVEKDPDAAVPSISTGWQPRHEPARICRLAGALGAPAGHAIAPREIKLWTEDGPLATMFRRVVEREPASVRLPFLVQTKYGSLPEHLLEGLEWRGFHVPCCAAVVCPIMPTKEKDVMGLLLLGLNPRRPYDNEYSKYVLLLCQKLTTSLASTVLLEEESRRAQNALKEESRRGQNAAARAAYNRAILLEKLAQQTAKVAEWNLRFKAVADSIPVGVCFGDQQGDLTYANETWLRMIGYPEDKAVSMQGFLACVEEEDQGILLRAYENLKSNPWVEFEFRITGSRSRSSSEASTADHASPDFGRSGLDLVSRQEMEARHVLATAKAERGVDGSTWVLTCLTDVTFQKQMVRDAIHRAQLAENMKRMAEFTVVGMCDMRLDGRLQSANKTFLDMCGLSKADPSITEIRPFEHCLRPEDLPIFEQNVQLMVHTKQQQQLDVRLRTNWRANDASGHEIAYPQWVEATLLPIMSSDHEVTSWLGCLSDVSMKKWQLEREKQRKEEAIQAKQEQDNFIDMISHEMRNPLGAILHCTESIIATLSRAQELLSPTNASGPNKVDEAPRDGDGDDDWKAEIGHLIDDSLENAGTVITCSQHQKYIVDDILTMSKLESKLLTVTPVTTSPVSLARDVFKMFLVEARRVDTDLSLVVGDSFKTLGHQFLDFDPTRVKQVLINLLTNALKFTRTGTTRNVSVHISAGRERPTDESAGVDFVPQHEQDNYKQPALHRLGDPVYLMFEVKDTGKGLTEDEKKLLFNRFVQASSRTHVNYGGSGLGLYISRRLSELQRGAIGVQSKPGVGSTFAFYIESYVPSADARREAEAADASAAGAARARLTNSGGTTRTQKPDESFLARAKHPGTMLSVPLGGLQTSLHAIRGVLLVEDNLINQQIARRYFVSLGFPVMVANHGIECLGLLTGTDRWLGDGTASKHDSPVNTSDTAGTSTSGPKSSDRVPLSIIIMDVEMPQMDGLTCTRRIRELERDGKLSTTGRGRIPILAVSANARPEQINEALEAGCDDVMVKPYRMPELIERMRILVAGPSAPGSVGEPEPEGVEEAS